MRLRFQLLQIPLVLRTPAVNRPRRGLVREQLRDLCHRRDFALPEQTFDGADDGLPALLRAVEVPQAGRAPARGLLQDVQEPGISPAHVASGGEPDVPGYLLDSPGWATPGSK